MNNRNYLQEGIFFLIRKKYIYIINKIHISNVMKSWNKYILKFKSPFQLRIRKTNITKFKSLMQWSGENDIQIKITVENPQLLIN